MFSSEIEMKKNFQQNDESLLHSINHRIYEIYATALSTETKRVLLVEKLLIELSSNRQQFEDNVDTLIEIPAPKKITIAGQEFELDNYWGRSFFWTKGSKLRMKLIQAKAEVTVLKNNFTNYQAKRNIITLLESNHLSWDSCETLRKNIDSSWSIANDLLYLSYYKQAELLFKTCILPHQTNYQGVIFMIEEILFLLGMGYTDKIKDFIRTKRLPDIVSPTVVFASERGSQRDRMLDNFFDNIEQINFEYQDVAAAFIELCKEWLQIGAGITNYKAIYAKESGIRMLEIAKLLWDKLPDQLARGNVWSGNFRKIHESIMFLIITIINKGSNEFTTEFIEEIAKSQKYPGRQSSDNFFTYRLQQHLVWISALPPSKELICTKTKVQQSLLDHPLPLYSLPEFQVKFSPKHAEVKALKNNKY